MLSEVSLNSITVNKGVWNLAQRKIFEIDFVIALLQLRVYSDAVVVVLIDCKAQKSQSVQIFLCFITNTG